MSRNNIVSNSTEGNYLGIENNTPPEGCPFDARPRLREDSNSLLQSCTSIDADARDFDEKTADVSGTLIQFQLFFSLTWRDLYRKMIPHPPPPVFFLFDLIVIMMILVIIIIITSIINIVQINMVFLYHYNYYYWSAR